MKSKSLTAICLNMAMLVTLLALLSACESVSTEAPPPEAAAGQTSASDTPGQADNTSGEQPAAPAETLSPESGIEAIPTATALSSPTAELPAAQANSEAGTLQAETSAQAATAVPTETPPPQLPPLNTLNLTLTPVASGFEKPLYVTHAGDGSGRLFVVEQAGRIWIVANGAVSPSPFLDIVSLVGSDASERGLLSVAFHPEYASNGLLYVDYTDKQGNTVIARYRVSEDPDQVDPNSAAVLLTFNQPYANHNGGQLLFGPDGYLYIGTGDGGAGGDPQDNAQNLNTLLGKILRIDVDAADPYGIPADNPFVNQADARSEIWSYGWRNPWRISFDRLTRDMYVGDVGQNQYEEVHWEPADAPGGGNYGWNLMEGFHCFEPADCDPASLGVVLPIVEYDHSQGCSVTGGSVYRGSRFPALTGVYFYGDFCSGTVWGLRLENDGAWSQAELLQSNYRISSFGQDEAGELYLVHHDGDIFQIGN